MIATMPGAISLNTPVEDLHSFRIARLGPALSHKLANAVLTILHDCSWRERALKQGPAFVAQHFGLERMMDELIEIYAHEYEL